MDKIMVIRKTYVSSRDKVSQLKAEGMASEAEATLVNDFVPAAQGYLKLLGELLQLQRSGLDAKAAEVAQIERTSQTYFVVLAALALLIGSISAWRLTVGITAPLKHAVTVARRVADGDLSTQIQVTGTDETGQLLQALHDMMPAWAAWSARYARARTTLRPLPPKLHRATTTCPLAPKSKPAHCNKPQPRWSS